ncbi:MAG: hypothetical protein ACLPN6_23900 [Streptosporangiaceae bacterium]|jgi:hypothetical protein
MPASDAAPLPRLGEVFFDVRGSSRSMRLSWYGDTGVAVFSIWQNGTCTGTFRLPIGELPRMAEALRRGPEPAEDQPGWADPRDWPPDERDRAGQAGWAEPGSTPGPTDQAAWPEHRDWPEQQDWPEQPDWPEQRDWPGEPDWPEQRDWPAEQDWPGQQEHGRSDSAEVTAPVGYPAHAGGYPAGMSGGHPARDATAYLPAPCDPGDRTTGSYPADRGPADYPADPPASYHQQPPADYDAGPITPPYHRVTAPGYGEPGYYPSAFPDHYRDSDEIGYREAGAQSTRTYPADEDSFGDGGGPAGPRPGSSSRG